MPTATLTVDTNGRILTWGKDAKELLGYSELEAVGQSVETIIPPHLRGSHKIGFRRFVQTGVSKLPEIVSTSALHKSGQIVRLQISVKAVYGAHGEIVSVQAMMKL